MAAVFLTVLFFAPLPVFYCFASVIVLVGAWEWANLSGLTRRPARMAYTAFFALLMLGVWFWQTFFAPIVYQPVFLASGVCWAIALLWVQTYPSSALLWRPKAVRAAMGFAVLMPAWLSLIYLRGSPQGHWLVLAVILLVAAADIGAYAAGRAFGRRKLAPMVSPGKTWEGVAGGVLAAVVIAAGYALVAAPSLVWLPILIAVPIALVSVLGDLFESMLKRHRGIKDSSQLLPGHGGVLDRVDGLLAALPIFAMAALFSDGKLAGL